MSAVHPSEQLRAELEQFTGYECAGMTPIPTPLPGLGVFPGGHGLWSAKPGFPLPPLVRPTVMIVANDFFSLDGFRKLQQQPMGESKSDPFWKNLQQLLTDAGVPLDACFFTNAIMGLRLVGPVEGKSPGFADPHFRAQCARFLVRQVELIRPQVILTLGEFAPQVLADVAPRMLNLSRWNSFAEVDRKERNLFRDVAIGPAELLVKAVAIMMHPSCRPWNVRQRCFREHTGHIAQVELVKAAMQLAEG